MTTMRKLEEDNKEFGAVSFGSKMDRILVIPWGPKAGMWRLLHTPTGARINRVLMCWEFSYQALRASKAEFFSKGERMCVSAISGMKLENAQRIVAARLTYAYSKVPLWAKKELRRWNRSDRIFLAKVLYWVRETGIELLKRDRQVWARIFRMAYDAGKAEKLKGIKLEASPADVLGLIFPSSLPVIREWALKEIAESITQYEATVEAIETTNRSLIAKAQGLADAGVDLTAENHHYAYSLSHGRYYPKDNTEVLKKMRGSLSKYKRPKWAYALSRTEVVLRLHKLAGLTQVPTAQEHNLLCRASDYITYGSDTQTGQKRKPMRKNLQALVLQYVLHNKVPPTDTYELEMTLLASALDNAPKPWREQLSTYVAL